MGLQQAVEHEILVSVGLDGVLSQHLVQSANRKVRSQSTSAAQRR